MLHARALISVQVEKQRQDDGAHTYAMTTLVPWGLDKRHVCEKFLQEPVALEPYGVPRQWIR